MPLRKQQKFASVRTRDKIKIEDRFTIIRVTDTRCHGSEGQELLLLVSSYFMTILDCVGYQNGKTATCVEMTLDVTFDAQNARKTSNLIQIVTNTVITSKPNKLMENRHV